MTKISTADLLELVKQTENERLIEIVQETKDVEFEWEFDHSNIYDCDYVIEVGDWFYDQFCKNCKPIQCNYCLAYAWHTYTDYNDKLWQEENYLEENNEIICAKKCENCENKCQINFDFWYYGQEEKFECGLKNNPETCEEKSVYNENQLTIFDLEK